MHPNTSLDLCRLMHDCLSPVCVMQVRQYLVDHAVIGQRPEVQTELSMEEAVQAWFIIKCDIGRCGDGIQVRLSFHDDVVNFFSSHCPLHLHFNHGAAVCKQHQPPADCCSARLSPIA